MFYMEILHLRHLRSSLPATADNTSTRKRLENPCLVSRKKLSLPRNVGVMHVCSQEITWKDKHPTYVKAKLKQLIRLWKQHPKSNNLRLEYRKQNTSFPITSMPKKTPGKSIKVLQVLQKKQFQCFFVLCFPLFCVIFPSDFCVRFL